DPRLLAGYRGSLRGIEVSLALEQKGLATVRATDVRFEPAAAGAAGDHDFRELLRRRGPALRQRVLNELLAGDRRPLRVSLGPGLEALEEACAALDWSVGGGPDVGLALGGVGRLAVGW